MPTDGVESPQGTDFPPLIVFDGVCVLCSGFARFVVRIDRDERFRFATAQSDLGDRLYRRYGLRTGDYDTVLVLIRGTPHTHLDAFVAVMDELGWPWRAVRILRLLPRRWGDALYSLVARNRYRLFGRKADCAIPSPALRSRLVG